LYSQYFTLSGYSLLDQT